MVVDIGVDGYSKLETNKQADYEFSKSNKELITLLDTGALPFTDERIFIVFPKEKTVAELIKMYETADKIIAPSWIDTSPQSIMLRDWRVYELSLTEQWYISLERDWTTYLLEFAKPKLQLPWYASAYKICAPWSFNKKLEQTLIKHWVDDPFVKQCIIEWMSLNNIQMIDLESGIVVWESPENKLHKIEVGKSIIIDIVSEILDQASHTQKNSYGNVTLDINHFSTLIDYIDSTYPNGDIKWIISEHLDNVTIRVVVK